MTYTEDLEQQIELLKEELAKKQELADFNRFIKHIGTDLPNIRFSKEALQDIKVFHGINVIQEIISLTLVEFLTNVKRKNIPEEFKEDFQKELNLICQKLRISLI